MEVLCTFKIMEFTNIIFLKAFLQIPTHVDIIEDNPAKESLWNSLDGILVFVGIIALIITFYWVAKKLQQQKRK